MTDYGKAFEESLSYLHNQYKAQSRAVIYQPKTSAEVLAKDKIIPMKSLPDFVGFLTFRGRGIAFDAKSTGSVAGWTLNPKQAHQFKILQEIDSTGAIAFFLIEARKLDTLFALRVRSDWLYDGGMPSLRFRQAPTFAEDELLTIPFGRFSMPDYLDKIENSRPFSSSLCVVPSNH